MRHAEMLIGCALCGDAGRRRTTPKNWPKARRDATNKTPGEGRGGGLDPACEAPAEGVCRDAIQGNTRRHQGASGMPSRDVQDAAWRNETLCEK